MSILDPCQFWTVLSIFTFVLADTEATAETEFAVKYPFNQVTTWAGVSVVPGTASATGAPPLTANLNVSAGPKVQAAGTPVAAVLLVTDARFFESPLSAA